MRTSLQLFLVVLLFLVSITLAIMVVVNRHEARHLFVELQKHEKDRDLLTAQWSRLKLEEGSLVNQVRIEKSAKQEMSMRPPRRYEIRIVTE